ncbi:HAMP domain-containing histidine kinase [Listeria booriae]|uniref:histidine kinase n=1 Tax=Listeria booriae TaxID=1552123 RepID=A0A7X1D114_9LIST|nr:HAMP domain-containing histidine kinase [Listeria booriae]MBC1356975.1 HAMP domain-containing histidine kinase [Listeria booriae]MBC1802156.1 HAMP domain-containing histidine kinase [Listeria booriae]MBC1890876.1 HAMP domain-containing histidine kinase [Listeria booriae]MBC1911304.1 HAMP domain-containing histidine kinase [Listeria booriae]MBC1975972.1 HAMP domain-containing histidine kinase [Listeria booriae]
MSIKMRFMLSYIAVILLTGVFLISAFVLGVCTLTGASPGQLYKSATLQRPLSTDEENAFLELKMLAKNTPDKLLQYQNFEKLENSGIQVVVRKNDTIVYSSSELSKKSLLVHMPEYELNNLNMRGTIDNQGDLFRYIKFDFLYSEGSHGSVMVLQPENSYTEIMQKWGIPIVGIILLFGFLVIALLSYFVAKSVIQPILHLKEGAEKIEAGNLDFEMEKTTGKNEIATLISTFEKMRIRLKKSLEVQEQYENNRKELLSNISHDLKTPITSIVGYIEGIQDGVANTPEKQAKYLEIAHTKAKDMNALIDELFLFSKLDLHKEPFYMRSVDLNALLAQIAEESEFSFPDAQISLTVPDEKLMTNADREKLKRVFENLIHNSMKYMDKTQAKITIQLEKQQDMAIITFGDNGKGIPDANLNAIFDRFYREEQSRNSNTGGSGLGLSIAKQIVEEHQGRIWATSELGVGTAVCVALPLKEEEAG